MMKRPLMIVAMLVLVAGAALFYEQVLAIFRGMSPLEAMQTIVTFVLHAVVVTILSYVAVSLPELVKPWMRSLRWKQRNRRVKDEGRTMNVKQPKLTNDALFRYLLTQSMSKPRREPPTGQASGDDIHLNF